MILFYLCIYRNAIYYYFSGPAVSVKRVCEIDAYEAAAIHIAEEKLDVTLRLHILVEILKGYPLWSLDVNLNSVSVRPQHLPLAHRIEPWLRFLNRFKYGNGQLSSAPRTSALLTHLCIQQQGSMHFT